jgi:hypothetical protein
MRKEAFRQTGLAHPDRPAVADRCRHVADGNQELARECRIRDDRHRPSGQPSYSKTHSLFLSPSQFLKCTNPDRFGPKRVWLRPRVSRTAPPGGTTTHSGRKHSWRRPHRRASSHADRSPGNAGSASGPLPCRCAGVHRRALPGRTVSVPMADVADWRRRHRLTGKAMTKRRNSLSLPDWSGSPRASLPLRA